MSRNLKFLLTKLVEMLHSQIHCFTASVTNFNYREHWIQSVNFAVETHAARSRGSADTHTDGRQMTQYHLRSLRGGEGNYKLLQGIMKDPAIL